MSILGTFLLKASQYIASNMTALSDWIDFIDFMMTVFDC